MFLAVGSWAFPGSVWTSPDGIQWTARNAEAEGYDYFYDVAYGNDIFVTVGSSGAVSTSPDGFNWTQRNSGVSNSLYCVGYGNGIFVAVGSNLIITSSDGIVWTQKYPKIYGAEQIVYRNNTFVVVGYYIYQSDPPPPATPSLKFPEFFEGRLSNPLK
jgi:hypothetical protein